MSCVFESFTVCLFLSQLVRSDFDLLHSGYLLRLVQSCNYFLDF